MKKEPEQSSLKKEEAKPLDPVELSNALSGSGTESKPAIRADAAPDQVTSCSLHSPNRLSHFWGFNNLWDFAFVGLTWD